MNIPTRQTILWRVEILESLRLWGNKYSFVTLEKGETVASS